MSGVVSGRKRRTLKGPDLVGRRLVGITKLCRWVFARLVAHCHCQGTRRSRRTDASVNRRAGELTPTRRFTHVTFRQNFSVFFLFPPPATQETPAPRPHRGRPFGTAPRGRPPGHNSCSPDGPSGEAARLHNSGW